MFKISYSKILALLLPICFFTALLTVPLGMSYFFPIYSPFTLIKSAWVHILGAFILVLSILSLRPWRGDAVLTWRGAKFFKAVAPVWIFLAAWSILSIWSWDQAQTWFGSYSRQLGLLFFFWLSVWHSFVVYYFGGFRSLKDLDATEAWQQGVRSVATLVSVAGALAGAYAFLQFCGFDFVVWQEAQLNSRAISTFGQPNFLGSFLLLSLPITLFFIFKPVRFWGRFLLFFSVALQLAGLVLSGSRSAWVAFAVVLMLVLLMLAWRRWGYKAMAILPIGALLILLFFYWLMPARLLSLRDLDSGSLALRRYFYQAAEEAISIRPWLGVGLENGGELIVRQYQPVWGVFMMIDGYTDKIHNSYLDIIIQTGLVGFVFWLGLYIFWAWQCWLLWKKPAGRSFALAVAAAMSAYGISLLFGIADISGVFYFWVLAALVVAGNLSLSKHKNHSTGVWLSLFIRQLAIINHRVKVATTAFIGGVASIILVGLAVLQIYLSVSSLQADYYYLQIYQRLPEQQYFTLSVLYSFLKESAHNPVNLTYYQRAFSQYALADFENLPDLSTRLIVREELKGMYQQLPPQGYENSVVRARLSCFLSGGDAAKADFNNLTSLSPYRPSVYRDFGICLQGSGETQTALDAYAHALSLLPASDDIRLNQEHKDYLHFYSYRLQTASGQLFLKQNNYQQALNSFSRAYFNYPSDIGNLKKMADILFLQKDYQGAISLLKHAFILQPDVYEWPLAIAAIYQETGFLVEADVYWQQARDLSSGVEIPKREDLIYR